MNYKKIYKNLYEKARNRVIEKENTEVHHSIPKNLFNTKHKKILEDILQISINDVDSEENLIRLSYREHYIAHLLLYNFLEKIIV